MFELSGKYTTAKIFADYVEESCLSQIVSMINHPAFTEPVAIMPDTHAGKGSVIGFTMKLGDKVIPNVIGVDIGCSVLTSKVKLETTEDLNLSKLDSEIRRSVPFGFHIRNKSLVNLEREFNWTRFQQKVCFLLNKLNPNFNIPELNYKWLIKKFEKMNIDVYQVQNSLGTLGSGNHYIEVGEDPNPNDKSYWVTIHTGSRNLGLKVCNYWQKKANDTCKEKCISELKFLEFEEMYNYLIDMIFCQEFASLNRKLISQQILQNLPVFSVTQIESVHNYIDPEDLIIRKGAIKSNLNDLLVIPFNMRDGMIIAKGKGNSDWNFSAPHGAGRIMSRSKAKQELSLEEFKEQMSGIYSSSVVQSTLDEAPDAYKNAEEIINLVDPTLEIVSKIKPIMNLKSC